MNKRTTSSALKRLTRRQMHQQRGWTWLLAPRPFDVVSSSLYIGVLLTDFFSGCPCHFSWWLVVLIPGTFLTLLSIDRLEYWFYGEETPSNVAACLLTARILLIELVAQLDSFSLSPFLYLIPPFLATLYFGNLAGSLLASLAWMTYLSKQWVHFPNWLSDGKMVNNLLIFTLGLIFAITMARMVVKEKKSRVQTQELLTALGASHRQLQTYSEQVAELATTRERNRVAREIHDTLGHYLTVINVQLEKARAFRSRDPEGAEQAIIQAKRLASEALQDVRRSVSALRAKEEAFSFTAAIAELIEHVESPSLSVEVSIEGDEKSFSRRALLTLYRAAQEGLTNIQKHARASRVKMEIHFTEAFASLSLSDNGSGFHLSTLNTLRAGRAGQYGLQGVQERLKLVGGQMRIESQPGLGTHFFLSIPKDLLANQAAPEGRSFELAGEDQSRHAR